MVGLTGATSIFFMIDAFLGVRFKGSGLLL